MILRQAAQRFAEGSSCLQRVSDLRRFPCSITMSPLSHVTAVEACRLRKAMAEQQNGCALQIAPSVAQANTRQSHRESLKPRKYLLKNRLSQLFS
jgi:hypothetical protein